MSSLNNFELAWKLYSFSNCYDKTFSDLTLLHIDNQCTAVFNDASGGKMDHPGNIPCQIHIGPHSLLNHLPIFYGILRLLGRSQMELQMSFCFLVMLYNILLLQVQFVLKNHIKL